MKLLSVCLSLLFINISHSPQTKNTVSKKVMIVRSYHELLELPKKTQNPHKVVADFSGDFTDYYIALYPSEPGTLKDIILGDYNEQINASKVFGFDLDRNAYLTVKSRYNLPKFWDESEAVLPPLKEINEGKTYYRLKGKPITLNLWTADAICEKHIKIVAGKAVDSIFIVKKLANLQPLDNFVDSLSCTVQYKSAN
ncbi:hypothetical protein [Pedobacter roseus]|uniref:Uncharacterized protein n=1 Tax=Pedobacter roseus TaxID=336820 RepID=A0A7G9QGD1_9SPHI|nr:hypothetical protein [Pedobacter roseus]QNN42406.1 hypothetical protein H9L23_25595 [Pedobacter roseus]